MIARITADVGPVIVKAAQSDCLPAEKGFSVSGFWHNMSSVISKKEPMKIESLVDRVARSSIAFSIFAAAVLMLLSGCETTNTQHTGNYSGSIQSSIQNSNDLVLREADTLRIVFPGADQLNTTDVIRRDGKITLPVIGEVVAVGKTPANFQKELA